MHLGMWRRLVSVGHQLGFLRYRQMGWGSKKKKRMSSEMSGCKEGQFAGIQPRMRLDLPPGGFLRPDGSPAADSSAGGTSSCCPGTASGSPTLFSVPHTEFSPSVAGVSAEWLVVGFPPLLRGAEGSPHSTPVGFPPGGLFLRLA